VPVDFRAYRDASKTVFDIARDYTPIIEPLSLDEAFLEVTGSIRRFGTAEHIAGEILERILTASGLHASFGVATCKTVAKIASDLRKPRGFVVVEPGDEAAFLAPLPLRRLPGSAGCRARVGRTGHLDARAARRPATRHRAASGGSRIGDFAVGARPGIDAAAVSVPGAPRSVSREETFARDVAQRDALHARIAELAGDVGARLRTGGWTARTVTLKLRYSDFTTISRQETLASSTAMTPRFATPRWRCSTPPGPVTRCACWASV